MVYGLKEKRTSFSKKDNSFILWICISNMLVNDTIFFPDYTLKIFKSSKLSLLLIIQIFQLLKINASLTLVKIKKFN